MSILVSIFPLIIHMPWIYVRHVLKVGVLVAFVYFTLDGTGLTLSLMAQKSLVSICPNNDYLSILLIPPPRVSIMLFLKSF